MFIVWCSMKMDFQGTDFWEKKKKQKEKKGKGFLVLNEKIGETYFVLICAKTEET